MADKISIKSSDLRAQLENEATADAALNRYYNAVTDEAFVVRLVLKPEYEIEYQPGEVRLEEFGGGMMDLANGYVRWRRKKKYARMRAAFPTRPILVAEGDSWFQHPLVVDTMDHLTDGHGYVVCPLDAAGATLEDMINEDEYLGKILSEGAKALLLSGGGNDLMGGHFGDWLKGYTPGTPGVNVERFINQAALGPAMNTLTGYYDEIVAKLKAEAPGVLLFVHTYEYVRPRADGKWLGKPMVQMGITDAKDMDGIIKYLIDRFAGILLNLQTAEPAIVRVVRNIGAVPPAMWYDEIHPSDFGFVPVASRFQAALQTAGITN